MHDRAGAFDNFGNFRHLFSEVFHFHIKRFPRFAADNHFLQRIQRQINDQRRNDRAGDKARADRNTDTGNCPKAGRRCKAFDRKALTQNRARAKETDAGNDLAAHTGDIHVHNAFVFIGYVNACEHHERRADCHQNMGTEACGPVGMFTLKADDTA